MSTFKEIAEEARVIAPSQSLGSIDYARMIARLAEAMERLEYNTAHLMAWATPRVYPLGDEPAAIRENLEALRREVPRPGKPELIERRTYTKITVEKDEQL